MTRFVDLHVHPPVEALLGGPFLPYEESLAAAAGERVEAMQLAELADRYRSRDARAVLLAWDAQMATGVPPLTDRAIADMVAAHSDVFSGFGCVDPRRGAAAISSVHEAARLGLRGVHVHPAAQQFDPSARSSFAVWDIADQLDFVVLVHTGLPVLGMGTVGGGGVELRFADPLLTDRVAAEFPDLTLVIVHRPGPWQTEAVAVATHKQNVWLCLSGPHTLDEATAEAVAGPLRDRTVFGSGLPTSTPEDCLAALEKAGLSDDVMTAVLVDNAEHLLD